jgi:hypothetical protein
MAAVHRFVASHGVRFSEVGEDGALVTWAQFDRAPELDTSEGEKRYVFETEDAAVVARIRKVKDYGITEDKSGVKSDGDK